jgi:hypothetical protein
VNDRARIEALLGASIPGDVGNVEYARVQPSSDLSFFTAYARFDATRAGFDAFVRRAGLHVAGSDDAFGLLPAAWRWPGAPPWWTASDETPAAAAAKRSGVDGWTVVKYEQGSVFLIVSDTGISEG